MTSPAARVVANIVLISAGAAAAGVILASPPLRRVAAHALRWWLGASIPVFLLNEIGHAWAQSARSDLT